MVLIGQNDSQREGNKFSLVTLREGKYPSYTLADTVNTKVYLGRIYKYILYQNYRKNDLTRQEKKHQFSL